MTNIKIFLATIVQFLCLIQGNSRSSSANLLHYLYHRMVTNDNKKQQCMISFFSSLVLKILIRPHCCFVWNIITSKILQVAVCNIIYIGNFFNKQEIGASASSKVTCETRYYFKDLILP